MDANKLILNSSVKHKSFGIGTVKDVSGQMITINFAESGDKKFIYPDAFIKFLSLNDPVLQEVVTNDIRLKNEEIEAEKALMRQKHEEESLEKEREKKSKPKKKTTRKPKVSPVSK